ncbi:MAG: hypothetical protein ACSHYF_16500 [Verrucomicrobiaceae bacterium]
MKTPLSRFAALVLVGLFGVSCTTAYDSQGRQVNTVSPEGAVIGAAAVGLIGYSMAKDRQKKKNAYYNQGYGYGQGYGSYGGYGNYGGYGDHGYSHRGHRHGRY